MKTKKYAGEDSSLVDEDTRRAVLERIQAMKTAGGGEGASLSAGPAMESVPRPVAKRTPMAPRAVRPTSDLDKKAEMAAYLKNAEQTAGSGTSAMARAKIKEASEAARRNYEMSQKEDLMKGYKPRYTPSASAPKTTQGAAYSKKPFMPDEVDTGYKKGGSVSSASKRADGCAQRGKTRGKMV
jgi:hypothetical protein